MDYPYWGNIDAADVTLEPGVFQGENVRNNGPAVWFDDGSGGLIVEAKDKASLISSLTDILDRVKALPDPLPDAKCKHCGRGIRWVPERDGEMLWRHRPYVVEFEPGKFRGPDDWVEECDDADGNEMRVPGPFSEGRWVTAWPETTDATPKVGDQVVDMTDADPEDESLATIAVVTGKEIGGVYELDSEYAAVGEALRVIVRHEGAEQAS
jgi:hypothetical protein